MAEPESDLSLRAAEVASDVTEADQPQERHNLMSTFTKAASSSARVAGRGTRAVRSGTSAVRSGAPCGW